MFVFGYNKKRHFASRDGSRKQNVESSREKLRTLVGGGGISDTPLNVLNRLIPQACHFVSKVSDITQNNHVTHVTNIS